MAINVHEIHRTLVMTDTLTKIFDLATDLHKKGNKYIGKQIDDIVVNSMKELDLLDEYWEREVK